LLQYTGKHFGEKGCCAAEDDGDSEAAQLVSIRCFLFCSCYSHATQKVDGHAWNNRNGKQEQAHGYDDEADEKDVEGQQLDVEPCAEERHELRCYHLCFNVCMCACVCVINCANTTCIRLCRATHTTPCPWRELAAFLLTPCPWGERVAFFFFSFALFLLGFCSSFFGGGKS